MTLLMANLVFIAILGSLSKNYQKIAITIPLLGGLLFALNSLMAPTLWEWSRKYTGLGLLSFLSLSKTDTTLFRQIFIWGALGCLLGATLIASLLKLSPNSLESATFNDLNSRTFINDKFGVRSMILGLFTILLFAIGLGGSVLTTSQYLESSGNPLILRIVSSLVVGTIPILILAARNNRYAKMNSLLLFLIFLILLGRGSRLSTIIVVAIFASNIFLGHRSTFRKIFTMLLILCLFTLGFKLNNIARSGPTGIFSIPGMIRKLTVDTTNNLTGLSLIGEAIASLTSWVPVVIASIGTISKDLVIENMNPLIGVGGDPYGYSSQGISILFPYLWTPLSTMGQLYGLGGGLLISFISFLLSTCIGAAFLKPLRGLGNFGFAIAATAIYVFQFLMFLQYSTRNWFRSFWLIILLTSIQIFLTFFQSQKIKKSKL